MFFNEDGSKNRTFIKDIDMSKIKFSVTYPSGFPSFNNLVNSGEVRIQLLRYKKGKFRFIGSADIPNDKYFGDPKIISKTSYKYISPNTNPENNIQIEIPTNWFVDTESLPIIQYYGEKLEIAHWKRGSKLAVMFMYKMPSGEWLKSPLSKTIKISRYSNGKYVRIISYIR